MSIISGSTPAAIGRSSQFRSAADRPTTLVTILPPATTPSSQEGVVGLCSGSGVGPSAEVGAAAAIENRINVSDGPLLPETSALAETATSTTTAGAGFASHHANRQIVGKYELGKVLAAGDFDCRTRRCTHIITGASYVVRIYFKSVLAEVSWMWDRVRESIRVQRTLPKHENIVEMVECFETHSSLYILMQDFQSTNVAVKFTAWRSNADAAAAVGFELSSDNPGAGGARGSGAGRLLHRSPPSSAGAQEGRLLRRALSFRLSSAAAVGMPLAGGVDGGDTSSRGGSAGSDRGRHSSDSSRLSSRGPLTLAALRAAADAMADPSKARVPLSQARKYFVQVVQGVLHLHRHGVVHTGIAPDHVLVNDQGVVKISNLISCCFCAKGKKLKELRGTRHGVAPEVLKNELYDPYLADAWSLGVLLYFMLNDGSYPHDGANTLQHIVYNHIRPPNPKLPPHAKDLLMRLLQPVPNDRLPVDAILQHPFCQDADKDDDEANDEQQQQQQQQRGPSRTGIRFGAGGMQQGRGPVASSTHPNRRGSVSRRQRHANYFAGEIELDGSGSMDSPGAGAACRSSSLSTTLDIGSGSLLLRSSSVASSSSGSGGRQASVSESEVNAANSNAEGDSANAPKSLVENFWDPVTGTFRVLLTQGITIEEEAALIIQLAWRAYRERKDFQRTTQELVARSRGLPPSGPANPPASQQNPQGLKRVNSMARWRPGEMQLTGARGAGVGVVGGESGDRGHAFAAGVPGAASRGLAGGGAGASPRPGECTTNTRQLSRSTSFRSSSFDLGIDEDRLASQQRRLSEAPWRQRQSMAPESPWLVRPPAALFARDGVGSGGGRLQRQPSMSAGGVARLRGSVVGHPQHNLSPPRQGSAISFNSSISGDVRDLFHGGGGGGGRGGSRSSYDLRHTLMPTSATGSICASASTSSSLSLSSTEGLLVRKQSMMRRPTTLASGRVGSVANLSALRSGAAAAAGAGMMVAAGGGGGGGGAAGQLVMSAAGQDGAGMTMMGPCGAAAASHAMMANGNGTTPSSVGALMAMMGPVPSAQTCPLCHRPPPTTRTITMVPYAKTPYVFRNGEYEKVSEAA